MRLQKEFPFGPGADNPHHLVTGFLETAANRQDLRHTDTRSHTDHGPFFLDLSGRTEGAQNGVYILLQCHAGQCL